MGNGRHTLTPCCALCGHVIAITDDAAEFSGSPDVIFHADCVERVGANAAGAAAVSLSASAAAANGVGAVTLDDRVRAIDKRSRHALIVAIDAHVGGEQRTWVIGGPSRWTHDELVTYCIRECVHVPGCPDGR